MGSGCHDADVDGNRYDENAIGRMNNHLCYPIRDTFSEPPVNAEII
jgi:hypothetical protein